MAVKTRNVGTSVTLECNGKNNTRMLLEGIPLPSHWKTTAKSTRYCQRCGARADQRDRFCRICGVELSSRGGEQLLTLEGEPRNRNLIKPRLILKLFGNTVMSIKEKVRVFIMPKQLEKQKPTPLTEAVSQIPHAEVEALVRKIQQLEGEKEALRLKFRKQRFGPLIASSLLTLGVVALISSIIFVSSILAFIGLGLTFWGALFFFIKPVAYVKAKLLDPTVVPSLIAVDKILSEEACQGKGLHLPPKYTEGCKEGMVFIPASNEVAISSIDEITGEKIFSKNPKGVYLLSPGYGLAKLFEKELGVDFSKVDLGYLQKNLPRLLVEDLEVVEEFSMDMEGEIVEVRMVGSIYRDLCHEVKKLANICLLTGCPMCSAIGCVLAKVTGKPVAFEGDKPSSDGLEIQARYRTIES